VDRREICAKDRMEWALWTRVACGESGCEARMKWR
jgi:hypothetical protein